MDPDPDEEDMEDLIWDDKRERHWKIIFENNDWGVDDKKYILHTKRWDVYIKEKKALIFYSLEVSGYDGNKVLWEVVENHVVEKGKKHDEIGLRGFDLSFLMNTRRGWLEKDWVGIIVYQC